MSDACKALPTWAISSLARPNSVASSSTAKPMKSSAAAANVHATAIVDPGAKVPASCRIGPYCVIGPDVELGEDNELIAQVVITGPTKIGSNNRVFPFVSLGMEPQDLKFKGEKTRL